MALARYPLLEGRNIAHGVVIGPSDSPAEIQVGRRIAEITASDCDGDCLLLMAEPRRVELAKKLDLERTEVITKNHRRLCSSHFELKDVIVKNLYSAGVGSCTLAMISAELQGDTASRQDLAVTVQACTDSLKYDVDTRAGRRKAKEILEKFGLPPHLTSRNDRRQFSSPGTTDPFNSSPIWEAVAQIFKSEIGVLADQTLPIRAFAHVLGHEAFDLTKEQIKELAAVLRWAAERCKAIHEDENLDEQERRNRFRDLLDTLRIWKRQRPGNPRHWAAAAWSLSCSSVNKDATGAVVLHAFAEELLPMLAEVCDARELIPLLPKSENPDGTVDYDIRWNHRGLELMPDTSQAIRRGGRRDYYPSLTPAEVARKDRKFEVSEGLARISLVSLREGVTTVVLAEAIRAGEVMVQPLQGTEARWIPAMETHAHGVFDDKGRLLAEIKDSTLAAFLAAGDLSGDLVVNGKTVEVIKV